MNRIKFIVVIALLLSGSCNQETVTQGLIPIYIDVDNIAGIYDIADDVEAEWEIFPLETSDECLLSEISQIIFQNGMYYISDEASVLHVFDSKGKMMKKLDKKGQGPGEYITLRSFDVIGHDVWVSDVNRRRLMIFDSMFNFKGEVPDLNLMAAHINHIGDNIYLASNWFNNDVKNCQLLKYNITDSAFKCLIEVGQVNTDIGVSKEQQMCRYRDDCLLFMQSYCDTIFQISDNAVEPKYKFSFSKRYQDIPLSYEQMVNRDEMIRGIELIIKTQNSVIIEYNDEGKSLMAIYNEMSKQCQVYSQFKHSALGNFVITLCKFTPDGEMICYHQPSTFLEHYDKLLDESKFKNPADLQKLKDAVKGITFDDNPVLIKFKLKKDSKL